MNEIIAAANRFFTGPVMVGGLLVIGLILSIKTGFVQFRYFGRAVKNVVGDICRPKTAKGGISPLAALATALSGTLGTGNIAGVAAAVALGGAGAVFWMFISSFFAMAIKYAEIVLAVKYKQDNCHGGAMYYIKKATGSKLLAVLFALFCLLSSFGVGNITQANTAAVALKSCFRLDDGTLRLIFLAFCVIIGIIILGGIKRASVITTAIIPVAAIFYVGCCFAVIFMDLTGFCEAISEILAAAFGLKAVSGGICGTAIANAMRVGFSKGVFTNEAGMGSAPIAHSAAETEYPAKQGLWGVFEVFIDTTLMCTLTGIVVVMSKTAEIEGLPISALALAAFERYLGTAAAAVVSFSTAVFALAAIIGWSCYGEAAVNYLFKDNKTALRIYKAAYAAAVYIGAVASVELVWAGSDIFNGLMMLPNLTAILLLTGEVKAETKLLKSKR